jgi:hypothetical protein
MQRQTFHNLTKKEPPVKPNVIKLMIDSRQEMTFGNGSFLSREKNTPGFWENIADSLLS